MAAGAIVESMIMNSARKPCCAKKPCSSAMYIGMYRHRRRLLNCISDLGDAALKHGPLVPEPRHSAAQLLMQFREIITAQVAQLDLLEIAPNPFVGVQLRRIGRELLQTDPRRATGGEKVADRLGPVDRRPVPDHQQLPRNIAQEVPEEAHHSGPLKGLPAHLHQ